ncbi:LemA family protein [Mycoplasma sp. Ms02]|uniref:LemA family protein n=1 Tax=Mycoplasma sp. Ms02 TaxID=353851 RepID=UPI001C8A3B46|nr:LemA family protein [Mycoplasma sp. Ms02]QZE12416.1 LemA family protein [Mycoplasma sp. Ms02]
MANLYDHSEQQDPNGFQPKPSNTRIQASAPAFLVVLMYISFILIIPIFWYVSKKNKLVSLQTSTNELASGIDIQLQKRADTLGKLVQQVASYKNFEKSTLENVAKMRTLSYSGNTAEYSEEIESLNKSVFGRLMAISENYPELKANTLYKELMDETTYIEREIAASRRLYNSKANQFNTEILTYFGNVPASAMKLSTLPLYQASVESRKDVDMSVLN